MNTNTLPGKLYTTQTHSGREVLYIKDLMKITGKGERAARRLSLVIRRTQNIRFVTLDAFCQYTGFTQEAVVRNLN